MTSTDDNLASSVDLRWADDILVGLAPLGGMVHETHSQGIGQVAPPLGCQQCQSEAHLLLLINLIERAECAGRVLGGCGANAMFIVEQACSHHGNGIGGRIMLSELLERKGAKAMCQRVGLEGVVLAVAQDIHAHAVDVAPRGIVLRCPAQDDAVAVGAREQVNLRVDDAHLHLRAVLDNFQGVVEHRAFGQVGRNLILLLLS